MSETTIEAWHFVRADASGKAPGILRDGAPVEVGRTYRVEPPVVPCERGLHGSRRAVDALTFAPGLVVCRVRLSGVIVEHGTPPDKLAASERTVLWAADASQAVVGWAAWCAERALEREREAGRKPDPRLQAAVEAARAWVMEPTPERAGAATDAARAATDAAWSATDATWSAVDAAWSAGDATCSAREAAVDATDAARSAAWASVEEAERTAQENELVRQLMELAPPTGGAEKEE